MFAPEIIDVSTLPSLPLMDKASLPSCPAIYFAISKDNEILYIGKTANLAQRWQLHHRYKELNYISGVRLAWLECADTSLLFGIEKALIDWFDPALNNSAIAKAPRATQMKVLLRQVRDAQSISLNDLAKLTDMSPQYLNRVELGKSNPSLETLGKLCTALRCQPGDLLIWVPKNGEIVQ